jgi:hypothetical protein
MSHDDPFLPASAAEQLAAAKLAESLQGSAGIAENTSNREVDDAGLSAALLLRLPTSLEPRAGVLDGLLLQFDDRLPRQATQRVWWKWLMAGLLPVAAIAMYLLLVRNESASVVASVLLRRPPTRIVEAQQLSLADGGKQRDYAATMTTYRRDYLDDLSQRYRAGR